MLDTSKFDPVVLELGRLFADAGYELSLVGGPVRDLFLGRNSVSGKEVGGFALGDGPRLWHHRLP